jgi:beta-glucanase (GH16 family)
MKTTRRQLLAMPLACMAPRAFGQPVKSRKPLPIADRDFKLVKNWHFGHTVTDLAGMRAEFFTRFIYDDGKLDKLNDEWQRYRDNANHEFSEQGLSLVARAPAGLKEGLIESGMLRSKWSFTYGYVEARMRVPKGRGLWPAFWLNPQDQIWPPEIDIVEIVNNGRDTTRQSFHFLHAGDGKEVPEQASSLDRWHRYQPGFDYADDFHVFAVLWEPGRVRHFVDELLVVDRQFNWVHKDGNPAGTVHVLVNLAVGGKWPGPPIEPKDFPARLAVDYIRLWQA